MVPQAAPGYEARTIYMACAVGGYVGQVVVEDGRVDMAAALDPLAVKAAGGPGELAARIIDEAGFPPPVPELAALPWKGVSPLHAASADARPRTAVHPRRCRRLRRTVHW